MWTSNQKAISQNFFIRTHYLLKTKNTNLFNEYLIIVYLGKAKNACQRQKSIGSPAEYKHRHQSNNLQVRGHYFPVNAFIFTILITFACLSMAACLMLSEMMLEMLLLMLMMTDKEETIMMDRGKKNPREKRKIL